MAVTRYEWTCPGCGKRFAVREGLEPALCPTCQASAGPKVSEAPAEAGSAAAPSPVFASIDDLADDFVTRPRRAPAPRMAGTKPTANTPVWTLDLRFERRLTPLFVRALWLLTVVAGISAAVIDIGVTASGGWTRGASAAQASGSDSAAVPGIGEQVRWNFTFLVGRLLAVLVAVLSVRVVCEGVLNVGQITHSLQAIQEATTGESAEQQP